MMEDLHITVTEPAKLLDKYGSGYIGYSIKSNANRKGFLAGGITVSRRYSDFSWLYKELSRKYPGIIIPPIPAKQSFTNKSSDDFIESRRRALEKFLERVSDHYTLGFASDFVLFLEADEETLLAAMTSFDEKESSKDSSASLSDRATSWMSAKVATKPILEPTQADIKVEEIAAYVKNLQKHISSITKKADALLKQEKEMSRAYFEFSQSFTYLGQSEGDALGSVLVEFGKSTENLSKASANSTVNQVVQFLEPLEEYNRLMDSIKMSLGHRQNAKTNYLNSLGELYTKQNAYRKLLGVPGKESQAVMKEASVSNAQDYADEMKVEFEKVSHSLLRDFELFKCQKASDMKRTIMSFIHLQVDYNNDAERIWSALYPKVEALAVTDFESISDHSLRDTSSATSMDHICSISTSSKGQEKAGGNKADPSFYTTMSDIPPPIPPRPAPAVPPTSQQSSNFEEHDGGDEDDEDLAG